MTKDANPTVVQTDVLIVGAGISGLAAARSLVGSDSGGASDSDIDVVVIEARDRVGGRLLSTPAGDDRRLDLGATWFWPGEARIAALIADLAVEVFPHYLDGDAMYHEPGRPQRLDGNPIDVPSGRFAQGADSLAAAVAAELPAGTVRLNEVVRTIDGSGDKMVVTTSVGSYEAAHVILALPPALAQHRISFVPELDDRLAGLAATTPVWMGATTKVVAHYANAFWRDNGLSGSAISHVGPMRELHDMSGPEGTPAAIFGFVPGIFGAETATADDVRQQLVEIFGDEAGEPLEITIQDWRSEEFTSPPDADRMGAYQTYGHPLYHRPAMNERLHWSSTETSPEYPGHIEGSLAAAERATTAIINERSRLAGNTH